MTDDDLSMSDDPQTLQGGPWSLQPPGRVARIIGTCLDRLRGLDLRKAEDHEIERCLLELRESIGSYLVQRRTSKPRRLWRVCPDDRRFDMKSDLLYPPATVARPNRCNKAQESLLYTSPLAPTAFDEMRATTGMRFRLIRYRAASLVHLDRLFGFPDPNPRQDPRILSGDDLESYRLLRDFARAEFTRAVGPGEECLYRISAAICRILTDYAGNDGWIYPSVRSRPNEGDEMDLSQSRDNVALKARAVDASIVVTAAYLVEIADHQVTRGGLCPRRGGVALDVLESGTVDGDTVVWKVVGRRATFYR